MVVLESGRIWLKASIVLLLLVPAVVVCVTVLQTDESPPGAGEPPDPPADAASAGPKPATPPQGSSDSRAARPIPLPAVASVPINPPAHPARAAGKAAPRLALGTVKTAEGRPVPGARVTLLPPRSLTPVLRPPLEPLTTTTDARGTFTLEVRPASNRDARTLRAVELSVEASGYFPFRGTFRLGIERQVVLHFPGSIGGLVVTDDDPPVPCAKARVTLMGLPGGRSGPATVTRTDSIGRFGFGHLMPGNYRTLVHVEGRPPLTDQIVQVRAREHTRAVFTIASGITVAGCVVEGPHGRPLPHVRVYTVVTADRPAITAADGKFRIEGLPRTVSLMLVKKGYVPRTVTVELDESAKHAERNTEMVRWAGVRGIVLGPGGQPFSHARVWIADPRHPVRSDADGTFELPEVHPGADIRVHAAAHPRLVGRSDPFTLRSGEQKGEISLQLQTLPPPAGDDSGEPPPRSAQADRASGLQPAHGVVSGSVVDESGEPVHGARVVLLKPRRGSRPWGEDLARMFARTIGHTTSDESGAFELKALPAGHYFLEARATGFLPRRGEAFDLIAGDGVTGKRLEVSRGFEVEIQLKDTDGSAIRNASLLLRRPGYTRSDSVRGATDLEGRATVGPVDASKYVIWIYEGGGRFDPIEVEFEPGRRFDLVVKRRDLRPSNHRFEGRVVLAETGAPAQSFWVRVDDGSRSGEQSFADAGGRFTWSTHRAGTYLVEAGTTDGRISDQRLPVTVSDNGPPPTVFLRLVAGAAIEGVVRDPDGNLVANAPVVLHRDSRIGPVARTVRTGADGSFRATGLSAGTFLLASAAEEWVEGTTRVTVTSGPPAGVELRLLRAGGSIAARIEDQRALPVAGAELTVKRLNGESVVPGLPQVKRLFRDVARRKPDLVWSDFFVQLFVSDRDGRIVQPFVPPGRYRVHAGRRTANATPVEVVVREGRATPVKLVLIESAEGR